LVKWRDLVKTGEILYLFIKELRPAVIEELTKKV
jgi:hypothetical protein